jgi:hypothetical protein
MTGNIEHPSRHSVVCSICSVPLPLETSKTDEGGNGVHEECYVRKTISRSKEAKTVQFPANWFELIIARLRAARAVHSRDRGTAQRN